MSISKGVAGTATCGTDFQAELNRRAVLKLGGTFAGILAGVIPGTNAVAGPFGEPEDFPIPADKKLDPVWVRSLFARGEPTVYRSSNGELGYIGMPIGGICCGQVYLGGDGQLWHWDVFNVSQGAEWAATHGPLYAAPARPASPIEQGFVLSVVRGDDRSDAALNASGFRDISFQGQYPIGLVRFADANVPAAVELEAFSPFCPLDEAMSGIPAIVVNYTVTNTSESPMEVSIAGFLRNPVCMRTGHGNAGTRITRGITGSVGGRAFAAVECAAAPAPPESTPVPAREDILIEDWEKGTYDGWVVTGKAFGDKPRALADMAAYQGDLNAQGSWTVNSHNTRGGEDVAGGDAQQGRLLGPLFRVERRYIAFRIGGGDHPGRTCVNLLVDGAVVRTATGHNSNRMRPESFDVREFAGREARIEIVDEWDGAWGNIGCDELVQTDRSAREPYDMASAPDFGTMTLAAIGPARSTPMSSLSAVGSIGWQTEKESRVETGLDDAPLGAAGHVPVALGPGASARFSFVIAWHFPTVDRNQLAFLTGASSLRRWYAGRFRDASAVRDAVIADLDRLSELTRSWRDTWYASTLPHWFLDRTFATVSTAATATCWRFDNGRFYGWEGTYCCAGTCTHVWHYAQGLARVFPLLERSTRQLVDFGLAYHEDTGQIDYRGEAGRDLAVDGQCGTILRAYREHTMSPDGAFLRRIWARVKKSLELMIARDPDANGILDGAQSNTLDATWYGRISWLTSMYLGALRAGEAMAEEMGDVDFADRCRGLVERGSREMVSQLFNGAYFVHLTDPSHPEANSTGDGCHIDQVLGESWLVQAGLERVLPRENLRSALASLYKYNFAPDVGPYRSKFDAVIRGGRWYAMPGEGGLLMCTWPRGGSEAATGKGGEAWAAGYFNECMTGFEHQAASHMIAEGLVLEGLAVTRMIHDRYHASKRNPWNEVECSNHYARAMAGYGSFISATGFSHHGPRGTVGFAPVIRDPSDRDRFQSAFISAEGWGRYGRSVARGRQRDEVRVAYGRLRVTEIALGLWDGLAPAESTAALNGERISCTMHAGGGRAVVTFSSTIEIAAGSSLAVELKQ